MRAQLGAGACFAAVSATLRVVLIFADGDATADPSAGLRLAAWH
ncbi:MAG: hypothetical protein AAGI44_15770 [Pseudomonadota bacterium]